MSAASNILKVWVTASGLIGVIVDIRWGLPDHLKTGHMADDGHLCGYVCLGKDSPFWEMDYDNEALTHAEVHGGLTFAGRLQAFPDFWALGFDCAHYQDSRETCTPEYVEAQVEKLASQVAIA